MLRRGEFHGNDGLKGLCFLPPDISNTTTAERKAPKKRKGLESELRQMEKNCCVSPAICLSSS